MKDKTVKTLTGDPSLVDAGFDSAPENPFILLQKWFNQAEKAHVKEPKTLVLSTVNEKNQPSSRVLLIKDVDGTGIIFSTSEKSLKGKDLEKNPWASGTLWWKETVQQINFKGMVTKLPGKVSDTIFQNRIRSAQAIAIISCQSMALEDETDLKNGVNALINSNEKIERPQTWHAYHLAIDEIEFWHGSPDRFHKRLKYNLIDGSWHHQRLQP